MDTLVFFFAGMLLCVPCCILVPRVLIRFGFLDVPEARSSHVSPIPKGGGVGIVLAFACIAHTSGLSKYIWLSLVALAILSFLNDLREISPVLRLAAQFSAAAMALIGVWEAGGVSWSGFLLIPALFFVVATANWYNFMDGINGIAGITGIVAVTCLIIFRGSGGTSDALMFSAVAILGALAGFLPFNLPRARIFMGDAGSIFLGSFFALSVCLCAQTWADFFVLASFLFPFYADETVTMLERLWRGESLLQPHRRHLYQFMANEMGIAHWKVSIAYGLIQVVVALLAVHFGRQGALAVMGLNAVGVGLWAGTHCVLKRHYSLNHEGGR